MATTSVAKQQQRKLATMVDAPHQQRSTPSSSSPFRHQQPLSQPAVVVSRQGTTAQLDTEGHDITASRLSGPIKLTGLFDRLGHGNFAVTPEIGQEFPKGQLDLAGILAAEDSPQNDELLRELASLGELLYPYCIFWLARGNSPSPSPTLARAFFFFMLIPLTCRLFPRASFAFPTPSFRSALPELDRSPPPINQFPLSFRSLASAVSHRGVVFVRGQSNLTQDLLHKLAHKIGVLSGRPHSSKLHIHPLTKDEGENAAFKGEKISSEPDA